MANTSRVIAVTIGVIMIATTRPAVKNACPEALGWANRESRSGMPAVALEIDE